MKIKNKTTKDKDLTLNQALLQRRGFLAALSMGGMMGLSAQAAKMCKGITPKQTEGPFYPVNEQSDKNWDLTRVDGLSGEAKGEKVIMTGRVLDELTCEPVADALVEIWQACESGRYNHPNDPNLNAELDPHFQYWGQVVTDREGTYLFKTIRPGAYPATETWMRPSHVHVKVEKRGYHELTTQMYFAGDPHNDTDRILQALSREEQKKLVVDFVVNPQSGVLTGIFDIVIKKVL